MLEIVVSYYNSLHFEKILDIYMYLLPDSKITIYDKSHTYENSKWTNIVKLKNVGRETDTYLSHIILNYDNLSEYTLFIQDDTNNHIPSILEFYEITNKVINSKQQFHLFKSTWREGGEVKIRTIIDGYYDIHSLLSPDSIKKACERFNINLPKSYTTETCAFFIVHKDIILKRSKEFYSNLRSWCVEHEQNPPVFEYLWKIIFV